MGKSRYIDNPLTCATIFERIGSLVNKGCWILKSPNLEALKRGYPAGLHLSGS